MKAEKKKKKAEKAERLSAYRSKKRLYAEFVHTIITKVLRRALGSTFFASFASFASVSDRCQTGVRQASDRHQIGAR